MNTKYEVSNITSSFSFGIFEALTADEAIEAVCREAGYKSKAHAEKEMGRDSELVAVEVT